MGQIVRSFLPRGTVEYLKTLPGEAMYDDTMTFMEKAYAHVGAHFDLEFQKRLIDTVLSRFHYFRGYHGCRPLSFESYRRNGLLVLTRERLAHMAHEVFEGSVPMAELMRLALKADLNTRIGSIYFCADADELVTSCGHYLIYGSESLSCLWDRSDGLAKQRFFECQERSRKLGVPTILVCDVPIEFLPPRCQIELGNSLVTRYFQLTSERPVPDREWSRNWGYSILQDLLAYYIRSHSHPAVIRDPLIGGSFQNPRTKCSWCEE